MKTRYDVIVIGVGSMGSAACYYLAKNGVDVLGIEQFDIVHDSGSHAGQSRIIRKAYFEHPDYVPLLERAYFNWKALEKETGEPLYYRTGLLYSGDPDHEIIKGVKRSASSYRIGLETLSPSELSQRYPPFRFPPHHEFLFEPDAGFVTPEKAIRVFSRLAEEHGAAIHTGEPVSDWELNGTELSVKTNATSYTCMKLIITSGAWSGKLIPGFKDIIRASRQFVAWVRPDKEENYMRGQFPCWMIADDHKPGCFYGFPMLDTAEFGEPAGLKLAHHHRAGPADPDKVNRNITMADEEDLRYCLSTYLPDVSQSIQTGKICLYGNSPDEHFIIDRLPGFREQVITACGFSGHGFKFAPVVGEMLSDLAVRGNTMLPIGFLSLDRFT